MPTASESAASEAEFWDGLSVWTEEGFPEVFADLPPTEVAVVRFHDPAEDLERRGERLGLPLASGSLADLAGAAAELARRESAAWAANVPDRAMRAYEERRHLFGDRIVHWAIPWLAAIGRCYPERRPVTQPHLDGLLSIGDEMRVAPSFGVGEGLHLPGEDALGPIETDADLPEFMASLWSGLVMTAATIRSMGLGETGRVIAAEPLQDASVVAEFSLLYDVSAARWSGYAQRQPGTAALWEAMSARATRTAGVLRERVQLLAG